MGTRKIQLTESEYDNFIIIGIACHLKEYRFCWLLNSKLGINLRRISDMNSEISAKSNIQKICHIYFYENTSFYENYFLLNNHCENGNFIEKIPNADYLLFVKEYADPDNINDLINKIREISQVLAVFRVEQNKIKNIDVILSDIELHLVEYNIEKKKSKSIPDMLTLSTKKTEKKKENKK